MPMVFPKAPEGKGAQDQAGQRQPAFLPVKPGEKSSNAPKPAAQPAPPEARPAPAEAAAGAGGDARADLPITPGIQRLIADVKRDLSNTVDSEMKRMESEFGSIVDQLSRQLIEARAHVDRLSAESDQLRKENEAAGKKLRLLKEVQEKLKDA